MSFLKELRIDALVLNKSCEMCWKPAWMYTGGTGARGQYLLEEKESGFGGGQILKLRQTAGEQISSCTGLASRVSCF